jgi:sulfotransferase
MKQLHFCGGLPRTGSTVLMNILQQNPNIFTTTTDPFPEILDSNILQKSRTKEKFQAMSAKQADEAVYGMAMGATIGWYAGLTEKPVVISKSREWSRVYHLFPDSKHIVMIRDLRDIVESFDRVNSKLKALHTIDNEGRNYATMCEDEKYNYHFTTLNSFSDPLHNSLPRYMEMFNSENIKFVRYEDFLKEPVFMINRIYEFLGIDSYFHDLENIQQSEMFEHDNAYFFEKTDHRVKQQMVPWSEPQRTLSNNFHDKIVDNHEWFYQAFYPEVLS